MRTINTTTATDRDRESETISSRDNNWNTTTNRQSNEDITSPWLWIESPVQELQELQRNNWDYIVNNSWNIILIQVLQRTKRIY